jgi:predicted RNase H-like nuclease (RuvC/YqgF family)
MDNPNDQEKKSFIKDTMRKFALHISGSESSLASQISQYEAEIGKLQDQIKTLEDESEGLLRNLEKTINQYEVLKRKYYPQYHHTSEQMNSGRKRNVKLAAALQDAKNQIAALQEDIDKLCAPPDSYGIALIPITDMANLTYRCCDRLRGDAEGLEKTAQSTAIKLQAIRALYRLLDCSSKMATSCVSEEIYTLPIFSKCNSLRAPPLAA